MELYIFVALLHVSKEIIIFSFITLDSYEKGLEYRNGVPFFNGKMTRKIILKCIVFGAGYKLEIKKPFKFLSVVIGFVPFVEL